MPGGMAGMMMGGMGGAGGDTPMSALFGGKKQGNQFGLTRAGGSGSYVDVTLRTSRNPSLAEALQAVPPGSKLEPTLQLKVLPQAKPVPTDRGDDSIEEPAEQPKGKIKLYWGCGAAIRPGQPKVVDFADEHDQGVRRYLQGTSRHAARHALRPGPSGLAEPHRQPPRAGRLVVRGRACVQRPGRA